MLTPCRTCKELIYLCIHYSGEYMTYHITHYSGEYITHHITHYSSEYMTHNITHYSGEDTSYLQCRYHASPKVQSTECLSWITSCRQCVPRIYWVLENVNYLHRWWLANTASTILCIVVSISHGYILFIVYISICDKNIINVYVPEIIIVYCE